ncbi:MAG: thioredoxin domain-containing protein [Myxococcota bacterium]
MRALPALLLVACAGSQGASTTPDEAPLPSREEALRTTGAASRGPADALVTLVEFSDFECPYCAEAAGLVEALRERYPEDLRVVFRHFPLSFHEAARPVHEAAVAVREQGGDPAFWRFHDRIYATRDLELGAVLDAAEAAGASRATVREAVAAERHAGTIDEDLAVGVRLGVTGTPTFILNGRLLFGAPALEEFAALVEAARDEARALVASGVPRGEVSARVTEAIGGPLPDDPDAPPPAPERAPRQGPSTAPIVVHVFADHPCIGCARTRPDLERLVRAFGGDVQVVHRFLPLEIHPGAALVAEAGVEVHAQVGDAGFRAFQASLDGAPALLDTAQLVALASAIEGVDADALRLALGDRRHRERVAADARAGRRLGIRATPTYVVGTRVLPARATFPELEAAADDAIDALGL